MKLLNKILHKVIYPSSLVFSIITLLIFLIQNANDDENKTFALFGLIYVCLLVIFASSLIYKSKLNTILKVLFHYLITSGSIVLYFVFFAKLGGNLQSNRLFVIFLITTVIYFVVAIPVLMIRTKKEKKQNEASDYKSQFGQ